MSDEAQIEVGVGGVCPLCERNQLTGPVIGMAPKIAIPIIGKREVHIQICPSCARTHGHQLINCADQIERRGS